MNEGNGAFSGMPAFGGPAAGPALQLNNSLKSLEAGTMSCELGSQGIKVHKEGYEIGAFGMKDIHSG